MSVTASMEAGPSIVGVTAVGVTAGPASDLDEIHNWTDLLYFFNHSLPECQVELSESTKRVALFVLYLAIFVMGRDWGLANEGKMALTAG